ncbi:MAG: HD domain-containing protein [Peptostreptococcaceae bacterium]|jgi:HD-GYP domain-containing protein (c-di-GMP phosphodiesterase class II)|nr:HD domain-containing protein [Peptostreptococcaceae bacterium]
MKRVPIDKIKAGMVINKDVLGINGTMLLYKGYMIENEMLLKKLLLNHNIEEIEIKSEEETNINSSNLVKTKINKDEEISKDDLLKIQRELEVTEFKESFEEVVDHLKTDFQDIIDGKEVEKDELQKRTQIAWDYDNKAFSILQFISKIKNENFSVYAHSTNLALISYTIGKWINLDKEQLEELTLSALLSDIGRYKVLEELVENIGYDEEKQRELMNKYPKYSYELIQDMNFISKDVKDAVLYHNERYDGSGYPGILSKDDIPLYSRIIAIAIVYDTLTSETSYRKKNTPFDAIRILETEYVEKLDIKILYNFLHRIGSSFVGSEVKLSDGRIGEVVFVPEEGIYKPYIRIKNTNEILNLNNKEYRNINVTDMI